MVAKLQQLWIQRRLLVIAVIVLTFSGMVWGASRFSRRTPTVATIEIQRGEFLDSVQLRGEVKALRSVTISAPAEAGDLQIVKIVPDGTSVKKGDVVVEFDHTKTDQELAQFRSTLKSAQAEIDQATAQARIAEEEDQTAVMKARYEVEAAKLEASKQEIVSRIEGEEAKLKLADAEQKLRESETKLKSDQSLNKSTIASKKQASSKAVYDTERAEHALTLMTPKAPSDGMISLIQRWHPEGQAPYKPGDRAWPGAAIAELPDVSSLRISVRVDETERGRLALNQPVSIQLESIPDRQFTGHVDTIGAIASMDFSSGWPFPRNFNLDIVADQSDARLRPGMTAQITVVVDRIPNALSVPALAIFQKSGQNVAYVWEGTQFEEKVVEIGKKSGDRVMIAKGLTPGQRVALKDPTGKE